MKAINKVNYRIIWFISLGVLTLLIWLLLFITGLVIDSSYYRVALNFRFATYTDWIMTILSFTVSNVALLAFFSGLLGGICSKILVTEGFTKEKDVLKMEGVNYLLYESPFISGFRGVFMFLAILSVQYLSSFSDLSSINNIAPDTKKNESIRDKQVYIQLMQEVTDSFSRHQIKNVMDRNERLEKEKDIDSLISKYIVYRDSLRSLNRFGGDSLKRSFWLKEKMRLTRKEMKVPPLVDIPGISTASYFKFAIIVSLLAFVCGYDPTRFNAFLSKVPLIGGTGNKEDEKNKPSGKPDS